VIQIQAATILYLPVTTNCGLGGPYLLCRPGYWKLAHVPHGLDSGQIADTYLRAALRSFGTPVNSGLWYVADCRRRNQPEVIMKHAHISVPSWILQLACQGSYTKRALGHHSYVYKGGRTQEPRTGWNCGEPQKPPAVWAPPPGNARPEGRKETREEPRRGEEEKGRKPPRQRPKEQD
jgi:hypothetical protein